MPDAENFIEVSDWNSLLETLHVGGLELPLRQLGDRAPVDAAAGQALIGREGLEVMQAAFERRGFLILGKEGPVPGVTRGGAGGRVNP
eukprot:3097211-Pyramimonas_sp.AAC.1